MINIIGKIRCYILLSDIKLVNWRGRATVGYVMFNMLTIGALYTQLSRKLFIGLRNSLVPCEANIDRFPMNPRIFKSDE